MGKSLPWFIQCTRKKAYICRPPFIFLSFLGESCIQWHYHRPYIFIFSLEVWIDVVIYGHSHYWLWCAGGWILLCWGSQMAGLPEWHLACELAPESNSTWQKTYSLVTWRWWWRIGVGHNIGQLHRERAVVWSSWGHMSRVREAGQVPPGVEKKQRKERWSDGAWRQCPLGSSWHV